MSNRECILANIQRIEFAYKKENQKDFTIEGIRWKELTEGYIINEYGDVASFRQKKPKLLKNDYIDSAGYIMLGILIKGIKRKNWKVHQLMGMAFLNHSSFKNPSLVIDHIDRNKLNNHVSNLRLVSSAENTRNRSKEACSSKFTNLNWCKKYKKWRAYIEKNGKRYHLGYFKTEEDAIPWINKAIDSLKNNEKVVSYRKPKTKTLPLGVVKRGKTRFAVCFRHKEKTYYIYSFPSEHQAQDAYLKSKENVMNGRHFKDGIHIEKYILLK